MEKKYQVFISSTYTDLIDERKKVLESLLIAECIPAGMESFVATDESQFEVIKKVIDLCDYYVLLIGGRYGSINDETKLSYTEMEYDYAVSKGIPVLVFCIDNISKLSSDKKEVEETKAAKLVMFKEKAVKNRMASIWTNADDLGSKVIAAIMKAKYEIERPGWVRGAAFDHEAVLTQISDLQKENMDLKIKNEALQEQIEGKIVSDTIFYEEVELHFTEMLFVLTSNTEIKRKTLKIRTDEVFKQISINFSGHLDSKRFSELFKCLCPGYYVNAQEAALLLRKFILLKLIDATTDKNGTEMYALSQKGIETMNKLNFGKGTK